MRLSKILGTEMAQSGGRLIIREVSPENQPTRKMLKELDDEIRARVEKVDVVCNRSKNQLSQSGY